MSFYDLACSELERLETQLEQLEKEISHLPKETIRCSKTRSTYTWYLIRNGERITVSKADEQGLLPDRAKRTLLECRRKDCLAEREALKSYMKLHPHPPGYESQLYNRSSAWSDLLETIIKRDNEALYAWQFEKFNTNPFHPEMLIHKTLRGELVRSKSECIIADYLFRNKIPYRYECELCLGERHIFPDFTIINPSSGKTFLLEHLGKLDDPSYRNDKVRDFHLYSRYGYLINRNLLLTSETKDNPLSSGAVDKYLSAYLN